MVVRSTWVGALALLCLATVVATGCAGDQQVSKPTQESHLKFLALLYGQFTGQNRGQPPKDEAEFKEFVRTNGSSFVQMSNVKTADELFVSERDGQPYVILYGAPMGAKSLNGQPVMGYEQVGAGGKRYIANSLGQIEDLDEAKFKELVP